MVRHISSIGGAICGAIVICGLVWATDAWANSPIDQLQRKEAEPTVEIFGADHAGRLWRFGARSEAREELGVLPAQFAGLSFDTDGQELWGITEAGEIWRIDMADLSGEPVISVPLPSAEHRYLDLAYVGLDQFWLLRREPDQGPVLLLELDVASEDLHDFGEILNQGEPIRPTSILNFLGSPWVLEGSTAFIVELPFFGELLPTTSFQFDTDLQGASFALGTEAVWWLGDFFEGRPGLGLMPTDGFGEPLPELPSYGFSGGLGPYTLVSRIVPRACAETPEELCFLEGRFQVRVRWATVGGGEGDGIAVPERSDTTGQFWFFDPQNRELMVKVLDGCAVNDRVWVFLAGGTNVELTVTVLDTATGQERIYTNGQGQTFETVLDTDAFVACSEQPGGEA